MGLNQEGNEEDSKKKGQKGDEKILIIIIKVASN